MRDVEREIFRKEVGDIDSTSPTKILWLISLQRACLSRGVPKQIPEWGAVAEGRLSHVFNETRIYRRVPTGANSHSG